MAAAAPTHTPSEAAHDASAAHAAEGAHASSGAAAHGADHASEAAAFPPFDTSLFASQLIWFGLTFIALYLVLSRVVLPRIGTVLEKRAGTIKSDLDAAAKKSMSAEQARADMEKAVAKARAEARALVDSSRADVTAKLAAEQEAAEGRLAERMGAAEAKVDAARRQALAEAPKLAEALAREIADKFVPRAAGGA